MALTKQDLNEISKIMDTKLEKFKEGLKPEFENLKTEIKEELKPEFKKLKDEIRKELKPEFKKVEENILDRLAPKFLIIEGRIESIDDNLEEVNKELKEMNIDITTTKGDLKKLIKDFNIYSHRTTKNVDTIARHFKNMDDRNNEYGDAIEYLKADTFMLKTILADKGKRKYKTSNQ